MRFVKTLSIAMLLLLPLLAFSSAWVSSDSIGAYMKNYGEIEIWGPVTPGDTTKQIDRITLLVGTDGPAVFDYYEDAEELVDRVVVKPEFPAAQTLLQIPLKKIV